LGVDEIDFQLTAVKPYELDWKTRYPVLAIRVKYNDAFSTRIGISRAKPAIGSIFDGKYFMEKDYYFLTVDQNDRFRWLVAHEGSLYKPEQDTVYKTENRKRITHYSLEENIPEGKEMITPVRPFSITGVTLEGFDPGKEYPVLAIDIDSYLPGEGREEGGSTRRASAPTQTQGTFRPSW